MQAMLHQLVYHMPGLVCAVSWASYFLAPSVANSWGRMVPGRFFMGLLQTLYSGKEVAFTQEKPLGQWMSCSQ
jgi:hypothetical protein